ncbi:MAG: sulfatase-like hydrolase/transferase, partial [Myxococcota bacterium]
MLGWLWIVACRPPVTSPPPEPETPAVERVELRFDGAPPTRLLVLSLDTTRRDAVGRYGEGPSATPFLDARLGESVVLDNHRSCSNWTGPSMLCATSGVDPVDIGALRPNDARNRLPTLARVLGEAGYATRLVSANPFFFGPDDALGFDRVTTLVDDEGRAEGVAAQLRADLDALADAPRWYAHAHFFDPHDPYCPPEAYLDGLPPIPFDVCTDPATAEYELWTDGTAEQRAAYVEHLRFRFRAELRYFDDTLAALWADLDARGDLDDTLVVFFTDHGEQFYERGTLGHSHELFAEETAAVA